MFGIRPETAAIVWTFHVAWQIPSPSPTSFHVVKPKRASKSADRFNAASAPGSAFNPDGNGTHYAGE